MFQSKNYCGGYDVDEMAFCFSYYDNKKVEYWFQLTLKQVKELIEGRIKEISLIIPR